MSRGKKTTEIIGEAPMAFGTFKIPDHMREREVMFFRAELASVLAATTQQNIQVAKIKECINHKKEVFLKKLLENREGKFIAIGNEENYGDNGYPVPNISLILCQKDIVHADVACEYLQEQVGATVVGAGFFGLPNMPAEFNTRSSSCDGLFSRYNLYEQTRPGYICYDSESCRKDYKYDYPVHEINQRRIMVAVAQQVILLMQENSELALD